MSNTPNTTFPLPVHEQVVVDGKTYNLPEFYSLVRVLRALEGGLNSLSGRTSPGAVFAGAINAGMHRIFGLTNSLVPTNDESVSYGLAQKLYAPSVMQLALSALGKNPLNVTNLPGLLRDAQNAGIPLLTALPDPKVTPDGFVFIFNNELWRFSASPLPGKSTVITTAAIIPSGLRSAQPAAGTAGLPYFQTDTGWLYIDNGTNYVYRLGINEDTRASRAAFPALSTKDNGAIWYETDTRWTYTVVAGAWVFGWGVAVGVRGTEPAPVAADTRALYLELDTNWLYECNGTNFVFVGGAIFSGTDAGKPAVTANDNGAWYYATDTDIYYEVRGGTWAKSAISLAAADAMVVNQLAIANGGTGANTAAGARTNLVAAISTAVGAHTITLAKITAGGANGSITWTADGTVSAFVDPT